MIETNRALYREELGMDLQVAKIVLDIMKKAIKDDGENQQDITYVDTLDIDSILAHMKLSSLLFVKIVTNIELQLEIEFEYEMLDMNQFNKISSIVAYTEKRMNKILNLPD
jgi:acyl carrier protein